MAFEKYPITILEIQSPVKTNSSSGHWVCHTMIKTSLGNGKTNSYLFYYKKSYAQEVYNKISKKIQNDGSFTFINGQEDYILDFLE
jgi:hypothetical protein